MWNNVQGKVYVKKNKKQPLQPGEDATLGVERRQKEEIFIDLYVPEKKKNETKSCDCLS